jgi:RimJ/RimL family protein N-acetyltransferase
MLEIRPMTDADIDAVAGIHVRSWQAGFPDMRLWVFTDNDRARRFYERAGLRPDGGTHYYTPGDTGVQLPELRYATPL